MNSSVGRFGRIDVFVNNARYGFTGAFEEMTEDEFKGRIDTNCWAVVNVTRAVLPILRARRSGRIFHVTSVGGRSAIPGHSGYHASEASCRQLRDRGWAL